MSIETVARKIAPEVVRMVVEAIEEDRRDCPENFLDVDRDDYLEQLNDDIDDMLEDVADAIRDAIDVEAVASKLYKSRPRIAWK